jgi:hypothetical protein
MKLLAIFRKTISTFTAVIVLSIALVGGPFAESAAAVTCRNTNYAAPYNLIYEIGDYDYQGKTPIRIVPGSSVSGCLHINATNIRGGYGTGGTCARFRIIFFDTNNNWLYVTGERPVCANANQVVAIATDVINGTHYLPIQWPVSDSVRYTIRD